MKDRTKEIVNLMLKVPPLLEAFKRDPKAFASTLGIGEQGYLWLEAGQRAVNDFVTQRSSRDSDRPSPARLHVQPHPTAPSSRIALTPMSPTEGTTVPIVAVIGLTSLTGLLAVTGVVAAVAINKDQS